MTVLFRPIPSLYVVYVLRSTVRPNSLYIGSTPHPPRRLKQHNGEAKGGAKRTSRDDYRPWEMVAVVSGLPGLVAALQFEWAVNNPHVSLHIPADTRISQPTRGARGRMQRPRKSIASIMSNIRLLLRVPSFVRWPLKLHIFSEDVHRAWDQACKSATEPLRGGIEILTDFRPPPRDKSGEQDDMDDDDEPDEQHEPVWGIHALPLDYAPLKDYVIKTKEIFDSERLGDCIVCKQNLSLRQGFYAVCPNECCEAVGHLRCWSDCLLDQESGDDIIPVTGRCPECQQLVVWGDMMKEMSLRMRGQKEIEKLLAKKKKRKSSKGTA